MMRRAIVGWTIRAMDESSLGRRHSGAPLKIRLTRIEGVGA
jgi:hypothetical protein